MKVNPPFAWRVNPHSQSGKAGQRDVVGILLSRGALQRPPHHRNYEICGLMELVFDRLFFELGCGRQKLK